MHRNLVLALCFLFLVQYFLQASWLGDIVVVLAVFVLIGCVRGARKFPRIIGSVMMILGVILEISKGAGIEGISEGILLILPLVCLVTLSPLLALPLKQGGYFKSVDDLLKYLLNKPNKLFGGITGTLFVLTPILSLGSVRIIHEFLSALKLPSTMTAKSYLIGFTSAVLWSPYFASVSLVLFYLDIPLGSYILYGLGLSILSIGLGNLLFLFWYRKHPLDQDLKALPIEEHDKRNLFKVAFFVVTLMVFSLTIEHITKWSMVVIVSIISIIFPILWGIFTKRVSQILPNFRTHRDYTIPMMNNEIMLFISGGLLGHAMQGTTFANTVSRYLTQIASHSYLIFSFCVLGIVLCLTYIGIHQIAVIGAMAMQLNAYEIGMSNISLAVLLLISWAISTAISPFSGLNLMVSSFIGKNGFETGIRANGLHMAVFALIGIGLSFVLR